jgi:hypothetical protein
MIGQEVAYNTVLLVVFDPPKQYRALGDISGSRCALGACGGAGDFEEGQVIDVTGLVCSVSSQEIWYQAEHAGFLGWVSTVFISQTSIQLDVTMESLDGTNYVALYDCSN